MRELRTGEVLYEQGDIAVPFFVVVSGELEIMRPFGTAETLVTVFGPGQFTGEVSTFPVDELSFEYVPVNPVKLSNLIASTC